LKKEVMGNVGGTEPRGRKLQRKEDAREKPFVPRAQTKGFVIPGEPEG